MASSAEYVRFVADQLSEAGGVTYKKLFGQYGLWRGGKFFATVEDDQFYVKPTEAGRRLLGDPPLAEPHEGARMYLVEELDDRDFLRRLVEATCAALPEPKARRRKAAPKEGK